MNIPDDLKTQYEGYRRAAIEHEDGEGILICELIERVAKAEQALAAAQARIAELEEATEGLVKAIRVSRFDPTSINRAVAVGRAIGRAALSLKEPA